MSKATKKQGTHGSEIDQLQTEIARLSARVEEVGEKESAAAAEEQRLSGALGALIGQARSPTEIGKTRRRLRQIDEQRADLRAGRQWLLSSLSEAEARLAAARREKGLHLLERDVTELRSLVKKLVALEAESASTGQLLVVAYGSLLTHARELRHATPGGGLVDVPDLDDVLWGALTSGGPGGSDHRGALTLAAVASRNAHAELRHLLAITVQSRGNAE